MNTEVGADDAGYDEPSSVVGDEPPERQAVPLSGPTRLALELNVFHQLEGRVVKGRDPITVSGTFAKGKPPDSPTNLPPVIGPGDVIG